jgi:hypothetical protein
MQLNLLWKGLEYDSMENCLVDINQSGAEITSAIVGYSQGMIYKVDYRIKVSERWETVLLEISSQHSDRNHLIRLESDGNGHWTNNGHEAPEFEGCMDVDIPLTPFTNTLPVRRLQLTPGKSKEVLVVYCDLLAEEIRPVRQKYTCLSATQYQYENVPNDFEATIEVDEFGLVVKYPSLFVRTAAADTHYS